MFRLVIFLFLLLLALNINMNGQVNDKEETIFLVIEEMPKYPGGENQMKRELQRIAHYPESAIKDSVEGEVVVEFYIDTLGYVREPKVVKGIRADLDNEAIRVVTQLKPFSPGKQRGKAVKVYMKIPITFHWNEYLLKDLIKQEKKRNKRIARFDKKNKKRRRIAPHPVY